MVVIDHADLVKQTVDLEAIKEAFGTSTQDSH